MKSLNFIIMRASEAYINEVDGMTVNTTIEDVSSINRIGVVVAAPNNVVVQEGDEILVHHNIMRLRNDTKGNEIESNYYLGDDLYFVALTEVFMYKRGEDWESLNPFCFVEPIEKKEEVQNTLFKLSKKDTSYKGYIKNKGILRYPNKDLIDQGLKTGDTIVFSDDSEYEFNINGKLFYKMATRDILMKE